MTKASTLVTGIGALLDRYSGRPTLVAIATMNVITGIVAAWILAPLSFGADVDFLRRGAQGLLDGTAVPDFVFTPLCAALAVPLALAPPTAAAIAMTTIGMGILVAGIVCETISLPTVDRLLIGVATITALPVVNELQLGQVTMVLAAGVYPARDRDGFLRGVPLGIALALVPKPLIVPILAWMLIWRRQALAGAAVTTAVLTLVGVALLGTDAYAAWIAALEAAGRVNREGSFSIWSGGFSALAVAVAGLVLAAFAWSLTESRRGFVAALLVGLLLAPYTLLYAASIMVLAVRPALAVAPRATRALALVMNPVMLEATAAWMGMGLAAAAWFPARSRLAGRAFRIPDTGGEPSHSMTDD